MSEDRWSSKFGEFVSSYGVTSLARAIDVHPSAVFHWMSGATYPKPPHACAMQFLAAERGFSLSLDEIYEAPRQVIAQACSPATDFHNEPIEKKVRAVLRKNPRCR